MPKAPPPPHTIYTAGHSNLSIEAFLLLLRGPGVDTVVDVRSQPVSRYTPHFNRAELSATLRAAGIRYAFMGDTLGGRPEHARYYDADGHVRYDLWSVSDAFRSGIEKLERAAARFCIALMCSEADATACHRHLLIARVLIDRGWPPGAILHIGAGGKLTPDDVLEPQADMFAETKPWRSPLSVLHKVQPSTSSSGFSAPE